MIVAGAYVTVHMRFTRRGVEDLGSEMVGKLTYYERWILSAINVLMEKRIITPDQITRKVTEVEERYREEGG